MFLLFSEPFTIAVIPDTQSYTNSDYQMQAGHPFNQSEIFDNQMYYILNNSISNGGNIVFAIHLGDFVQHKAEREVEWELAVRAMSIIDGKVPFGCVIGNHDYDGLISLDGGKSYHIDGSNTYNKYFGADSIFFKNKDWYGESHHDGRDSWSIIDTGNEKFLFLGLELEPSNESVKWAQQVLDDHKEYPTILVTHEYLGLNIDNMTEGKAELLKQNYRNGFDRNTPLELWNKLITVNNQIFLVLCGHYFKGHRGESFRQDINKQGYPVYTLLSDYQGRKEIPKMYGKKNNCGDGWLRLLNFDSERKFIKVETYSSDLKKYEVDVDSQYRIELDFDWNERFAK